MNQVYSAITRSPVWPNTVLIINYDEWGGFFDHVPPGMAPDPNPAFSLRGFRTPAMMIAPWAKNKFVSSVEYDHTSVLKMIEWRWSLPPLTIRDASANNMAEALDFTKAKKNAPTYSVPSGFFGSPCIAGAPPIPTKWAFLKAAAQVHGWLV
jgi:phospholipase C